MAVHDGIPVWRDGLRDRSSVTRRQLTRLVELWPDLTAKVRADSLSCVHLWMPFLFAARPDRLEARELTSVVMLALDDESLAIRWLALHIACALKPPARRIVRKIQEGARRTPLYRPERMLWGAAATALAPRSVDTAELARTMVVVGARHPELLVCVLERWLRRRGLIVASPVPARLLWSAVELGGEPTATRKRIRVWRPASPYALTGSRDDGITLLTALFPDEHDQVVAWLARSFAETDNETLISLARACRDSAQRRALFERAATASNVWARFYALEALGRADEARLCHKEAEGELHADLRRAAARGASGCVNR